MGNVFTSESELENIKIYAVTRLTHDDTPSHNNESVSKYTEKELNDQIREDIEDQRKYRGFPGILKLGK